MSTTKERRLKATIRYPSPPKRFAFWVENSAYANEWLKPFHYLFHIGKITPETLTDNGELIKQLRKLKNSMFPTKDSLQDLTVALQEFTLTVETLHHLTLPKANEQTGEVCFETYNAKLSTSYSGMPYTESYTSLRWLINTYISQNNSYPEFANTLTQMTLLELLTLSNKALEQSSEDSATQWIGQQLSPKHQNLFLHTEKMQLFIRDISEHKSRLSAEMLAKLIYNHMLTAMQAEPETYQRPMYK